MGSRYAVVLAPLLATACARPQAPIPPRVDTAPATQADPICRSTGEAQEIASNVWANHVTVQSRPQGNFEVSIADVEPCLTVAVARNGAPLGGPVLGHCPQTDPSGAATATNGTETYTAHSEQWETEPPHLVLPQPPHAPPMVPPPMVPSHLIPSQPRHVISSQPPHAPRQTQPAPPPSSSLGSPPPMPPRPPASPQPVPTTPAPPHTTTSAGVVPPPRKSPPPPGPQPVAPFTAPAVVTPVTVVAATPHPTPHPNPHANPHSHANPAPAKAAPAPPPPFRQAAPPQQPATTYKPGQPAMPVGVLVTVVLTPCVATVATRLGRVMTGA